MGELEDRFGDRSSMDVFFDDEKLVFVAAKSFGGFGGAGSISLVLRPVPDEELALKVREAWDAREYVPEYDDDALRASWEPVCREFSVRRYSEARHVIANRLDDFIGVLPSEWKGDNRVRSAKHRIDLPLDVSDAELGAAVRRAMELTTS